MAKKAAKQIDFSKNLKLYYIAVAVIVLGYIILSLGGANSFTSLTLGPIVLVIGYLIAIPIALLSGVGKSPEETDVQSEEKKG